MTAATVAVSSNWTAEKPSADQAPGSVLAVVQKGYTLNGRLLRPARVLVARAPDPPAD